MYRTYTLSAKVTQLLYMYFVLYILLRTYRPIAYLGRAVWTNLDGDPALRCTLKVRRVGSHSFSSFK